MRCIAGQLAARHSCGHLTLAAQLAPRTRTQVVEDIPFERVRQQKATQQEKKQASMDFQAAMQTNDKQAVSGSIKDILYKKRMERELLRAKGLLKEAEKPPEEVCSCVGPIVLALSACTPMHVVTMLPIFSQQHAGGCTRLWASSRQLYAITQRAQARQLRAAQPACACGGCRRRPHGGAAA